MLASAVFRRSERLLGTTLCSKWRLDAILGIGGMATVYAATHRNRARVAIKMLHPEHSIDDQIRAKFLREGYVANTIRHPGAVSIIDDDTSEDGAAFLVMELLTGESLGQRMKRHRGRLAPREALLITEQLLEVLCAAHAKGVVHRDIKPENVFITVSGQLKVLDFGIARLRVENGTNSIATGIFCGTPGFAPPEQARGRTNEVDARSDVYAVGATLFTMLTGRLVHDGATATERLALTIGLPAPSIVNIAPELPSAIIGLVDRALRYDKRDRWPSAKAMLAAVRAALPAAGAGPGETELPSTLTMPTSMLSALLDECRSTLTGPGPNSTVRFVGGSRKAALQRKWQVPLIVAFVAAGIGGSAFALSTSLKGKSVDVLASDAAPAPDVEPLANTESDAIVVTPVVNAAPEPYPVAPPAPNSDAARMELRAEAATVGVASVGESVTGERSNPVPKARSASASHPRSESAPRAVSTVASKTQGSEPTSPASAQSAAPAATSTVSEPKAASTGKPQPPTVFGRRR